MLGMRQHENTHTLYARLCTYIASACAAPLLHSKSCVCTRRGCYIWVVCVCVSVCVCSWVCFGVYDVNVTSMQNCVSRDVMHAASTPSLSTHQPPTFHPTAHIPCNLVVYSISRACKQIRCAGWRRRPVAHIRATHSTYINSTAPRAPTVLDARVAPHIHTWHTGGACVHTLKMVIQLMKMLNSAILSTMSSNERAVPHSLYAYTYIAPLSC